MPCAHEARPTNCESGKAPCTTIIGSLGYTAITLSAGDPPTHQAGLQKPYLAGSSDHACHPLAQVLSSASQSDTDAGGTGGRTVTV
mmetsp:Transcript_18763/g.47931  ORF Transcript_18763/g.47931 Transcript_18763/m.47931 type:complete len:86 (-) Transcript_18763:90-347(-)